ncbi:MAG: YfcE family phosphodiesterase [Firmicutes bacterium]|nr:YfcE family phosphodiesterase [Candidatus Alectryobacillus merdavium]
MRILLVSDSHGDFESLNNLLILHPDCDYYFHLGDSCLPKYYMQSFLCIKGNCDFEDFDTIREITINNIKFHLEHGDKIFKKIDNYIKNIDCDVFLFGHTHCKLNTKINNKIVINPGSLSRPRDDTKGSYAIISFNSLKDMKCQFFYLE